jgi:hypothetical protein
MNWPLTSSLHAIRVIVIFGEVGLLEYREALTLRERRNSSGSMEF